MSAPLLVGGEALRALHEGGELRRGRARVDGLGCHPHALLEVARLASRHQGRRRVHEDDVPSRAGLAPEHEADDLRVLAAVAAPEITDRRAGQAEVLGAHARAPHHPLVHLGDLALAGVGDLVEPVGAVDDERPDGAELREHAGQGLREARRRDLDQLGVRAGGIRQRPQEIEDGPDTDLTTGRHHVLHGRVQERGIHEPDADLVDAAPHLRGGELEADPEGLHDVGRSHKVEDERLPCLATFSPAPATTKAVAVETLKVPEASPPVPQVSMSISRSVPARAASTWPRGRTRTAFQRITSASPISSSTVSPFMRSAVRNAATWTWVAAPDMIASIAAAASSRVRSRRSTRARIASTMTGLDMAAPLVTSSAGS